MATIVGIAGGTGSGKTTVARALAGVFNGICVALDSYYLDRSGVSFDARSLLNYDEPAAIDHELLIEQLQQLALGKTVLKPILFT